MIKRLLLLFFSLKASAFAQFQNDSCLSTYVEYSLRKAKWLPHQSFEFKFDNSAHIIAYNAVEAEDLLRLDSLTKDARRLVEKMVSVINELVSPMSINIAVHYFDKTRYPVGNTMLFWTYVKDNKIVQFDAHTLAVDPNSLGYNNYNAIEKLRGFKLAPHQFLFPFMPKGIYNPKELMAVVALVNVIDDWKGDHARESRRQARALVKHTTKGGPFRRVIVRFQQRANADNLKDFSYPIL